MTPEDRKQMEADAEFSRAVARQLFLIFAGLIAASSLLMLLVDG